MPLSADDKMRLARLLAMFSSDFEGEITNAARAAERLVKKCGETWESILVGPIPKFSDRQERPSYKGPEPTADQNDIRECLKRANLLSEWERKFLQDVLGRGYALTEKQQSILARIKQKLAAYSGMYW